ncbi:N1R/p28-like protein [Fowlpox virus]|nr:N1R/p28-like protein [Fowlpox virus]
MDFTHNITRHIDNKFCCIRYGNLELIMLKDNGFINATKLCNLGNKKFRNWRKLQSSKDLIRILSFNNNDKIILEIGLISTSIYRYELVGTYVHRDLIPYIALWVFPNVAIIYSDVINRYLINCVDPKHDVNYFVNAMCYLNNKYARKLKKNTKMVEMRYKNYTDKLKEQNRILEYRISKLEEKIRSLTTK